MSEKEGSTLGGDIQKQADLTVSTRPTRKNVDQLVAEVIAALPELAEYSNDLSLIGHVMATYIGLDGKPAIRVNPDKAAVWLQQTKGKTVIDVKAACGRVILGGAAEALTSLQMEFEDKTGAKATGDEFDAFTQRHDQETDELDYYRDWVTKVVTLATQIATMFNLPNPDPEAISEQPKMPKVSIIGRVKRSAEALGVKAGVLEPADTTSVGPLPSWKTEHILKEGDPDLEKLNITQEVLGMSGDMQEKADALTNLDLIGSNLSVVLNSAAKKARGEEALCRRIEQEVSKDQADFRRRWEAIRFIKAITNQVRDYLFPGEAFQLPETA